MQSAIQHKKGIKINVDVVRLIACDEVVSYGLIAGLYTTDI